MEIEKFTSEQVRGLLSHINRVNPNDANVDIDPERTSLNYSLTPYIDIQREDYQIDKSTRDEVRKIEWEYYRQRKSELYCYRRADVCTLAGCVVSLPEELVGYPEKAERFFSAVSQFLCERYGGTPTEDGRRYPNVISVSVHYDERQINASNGVRGHMHFSWIPAVKIDKEALMRKKNHIKLMEFFDYKISAKEQLNKRDLETLHQDLASYLDSKGVEGKVLFKTDNGGRNVNIPVSQLKDYTDRTGKTIDRELLKDLTVDKLVDALDHKQNRERDFEWGSHNEWGKHDRREKEWTR